MDDVLVTSAQAARFVAGLEAETGYIGLGWRPHPVPPAKAPPLQEGLT